MNKVEVKFIEAEQDWANETTRYWFELNGTDYGTNCEFKDEKFAIAESGQETKVLDSDGCPITEGDGVYIAVMKNAIVTDEIRKEASGL